MVSGTVTGDRNASCDDRAYFKEVWIWCIFKVHKVQILGLL